MSLKWIIGSILFAFFLSYFSFTAYHLPMHAGPDYQFSRAASDFYYQYNRMATVDEDEDKMVFSAYGNTRLLRPPLGFYLPAQIAKLPIINSVDRYFAYRLGNALLGALTVLLCFLAIRLYFQSNSYAVFAALCVGLMPQFTFYASYLNDDMVALFGASFTAYAMVRVLKCGDTKWSLFLFAAAVGLTIISKQTAWIFFGAAILFYCFFILKPNSHFLSKHLFMGVIFIATGGWWLLFNMYHYGWNDPVLSKVSQALVQKYATYNLSEFGFSAKHGIEMKHLLILNFMNFIGASYQAVVGHLDWLKLRVGSLQYGFYLWMVCAIALNLICLLIDTGKLFVKNNAPDLDKDSTELKIIIGFQWIMYSAIIIQVLIYTWHNVYQDIQIQGKYLMPVLIPLLILAFSFVQRVDHFLKANKRDMTISKTRNFALLLVLFSIPVLVHLDALVDYVIPFYWPNMPIPAVLSWL